MAVIAERRGVVCLSRRRRDCIGSGHFQLHWPFEKIHWPGGSLHALAVQPRGDLGQLQPRLVALPDAVAAPVHAVHRLGPLRYPPIPFTAELVPRGAQPHGWHGLPVLVDVELGRVSVPAQVRAPGLSGPDA